MSGRSKLYAASAADLEQWLVAQRCHDVSMVTVTIGNQSWDAALYSQAHTYDAAMDACVRGHKKPGDTYVRTGLYCLGVLPRAWLKAKRDSVGAKCVCFPAADGTDWYVATYWTPSDIRGLAEGFILCPWAIESGERIDDRTSRPYIRVPMTTVPR